MKKVILVAIVAILGVVSVSAQNNIWGASDNRAFSYSSQDASVKFTNKSNYSMTLRIINSNGGLYLTVQLYANSSRNVSFSSTSSYKLKIKAVHNGQTSYHDGGNFSVTCTKTQITEGEMTFSMSTYGSGLGPTISAKEFESNY